MPDDVSKKSLKVLDKKLQMLAEHAEFHVNINSVVGGGIHNPDDALVVGKRAVELGFHVHRRHHPRWRRPAASAERSRARRVPRDEGHGEARLRAVQLFPGRHRAWASRTIGSAAPGRATCTSARTGWCTIARSSAGYPAKPLDEYTVEDIRREYLTEKGCAPYCTVSCVHYISYFDFWRGKQTIRTEPQEQRTPELVQISGPATGTRA